MSSKTPLITQQHPGQATGHSSLQTKETHKKLDI